VARAALGGVLNAKRLLAIDPVDAMRDLQTIRGLGPSTARLVVIPGTGFTDLLPEREPQVLGLAEQLYELDAPPVAGGIPRPRRPWRPFRTWAMVLIRAAAHRVLPAT
jgi:DNA-3-methyladenine glycosylase II